MLIRQVVMIGMLRSIYLYLGVTLMVSAVPSYSLRLSIYFQYYAARYVLNNVLKHRGAVVSSFYSINFIFGR